jgi:deazaflavin-dependent oxidoreductase (nitroreductase family)
MAQLVYQAARFDRLVLNVWVYFHFETDLEEWAMGNEIISGKGRAEKRIYQQQESGWMVYPARGRNKWIYKIPVFLWQLGLSRFLPENYLLLTTTGRKTGKPRRTMLEFTLVDDQIYLLSGWGLRSQWCKNLVANPQATVQTARFGMSAGYAVRVTGDDEIVNFYRMARGNSPIWNTFLSSWGIQDDPQDFLDKKDRLVIFRIDPVASPASASR